MALYELYRFEKDGSGPYSHPEHAGRIIPFGYHNDGKDHPTPAEQRVAWGKCYCKSKYHLIKWFKEFLIPLKKCGFKLYRYRVPLNEISSNNHPSGQCTTLCFAQYHKEQVSFVDAYLSYLNTHKFINEIEQCDL